MADRSLIECTDATWNAVTGCDKISSGCKNCYAERHWKRLTGNRRTVYFGRPFTDVRTHPERLSQPRHWRKPRLVFVNSMSDLFHPDVSFEFIHLLWQNMMAAHRHVYQILTKRPQRAAAFFRWNASLPAHQRIQPYCRQVWLGVSVENQDLAEERVPSLLELPAAVRWVCVEPLLGPLDLAPFLDRREGEPPPATARCDHCKGQVHGAGEGRPGAAIHWVVVGGENGPRARTCHVDWLRGVVEQCRTFRVPVFVRQLGARAHWEVDGQTTLMPVEARKMGGRPHWPAGLGPQEYPRY